LNLSSHYKHNSMKSQRMTHFGLQVPEVRISGISHFRVLVVSASFDGLSLIQRHRLVNEALREELSSCVHALAIQAKTPAQSTCHRRKILGPRGSPDNCPVAAP
uniref:BolA family member 1 n=1 Tax=Gadus morhua TaxID=8049 RepID=A0A8C5CV39_GADMO